MTSGDSISPRQTSVSRTEGESVTLSCSYTASSSNVFLYWYRQNLNRALEYILQKGTGSVSSYSHTADFAKTRFTSTADRSSTTITISKLALSDAAIYHSALRIAQCENSLGRCTKTLSAVTGTGPLPGISSGDQISQKEASVLKTEEETATLECTFSTSSTRYWLHWYRQYPGTAPQFILFSGSGSFTADMPKNDSPPLQTKAVV
ncbi:UNVERIFIED_CONTAM: hypothetical protein FKN15_057184 [Acipenser sinensis]